MSLSEVEAGIVIFGVLSSLIIGTCFWVFQVRAIAVAAQDAANRAGANVAELEDKLETRAIAIETKYDGQFVLVEGRYDVRLSSIENKLDEVAKDLHILIGSQGRKRRRR